MSVRAISSLVDLKKLSGGRKLTVIDFFANWCGPCKMIAPKVESLASNYPYVNFVKVDVDQAPEIAHEFRIQAMPTFFFLKEGQVIDQFQGADYNRLESIVKREAVRDAPDPIPDDETLEKMTGRQLITLMAAHSISSVGLTEKPDVIAELKKFRDANPKAAKQ
jgi:thioredoxin 1